MALINVYIDSCAWNYLFRKQIDLLVELPTQEYSLYITREVEIEIDAIPESGKDGSDKRPLIDYIRASLETSAVLTSATFGFRTFDGDGHPSKVQVWTGFNTGTFQPEMQRQYYASQKVQAQLSGSKRNSGLVHNQADASLACHARDAFILTDESRTESGPLRDAAEAGMSVVYLSSEVEPTGLPIGQYILKTYFGS